MILLANSDCRKTKPPKTTHLYLHMPFMIHKDSADRSLWDNSDKIENTIKTHYSSSKYKEPMNDVHWLFENISHDNENEKTTPNTPPINTGSQVLRHQSRRPSPSRHQSRRDHSNASSSYWRADESSIHCGSNNRSWPKWQSSH